MEDKQKLIEKIKKLKKEKNAVILVHNYQHQDIYQVADFLGDSLDLSRSAHETNADLIIFAGVLFMAETAKILSPAKKVILPRFDAGCLMADMITADDVVELREKYPEAKVVSYVNTTAAVKAVSDICCTSANAVEIVKSLPNKRIIFIPDKNFGSWVARQIPEKEFILYPGFCYVHNNFNIDMIKKAREMFPEAIIIVHPECTPDVTAAADKVLSTSGMVKYAKNCPNTRIIVGTEEGLINRLRMENPEKEFYSLGASKVCFNMKKIRLEDVLKSLEKEETEIILSQDVIEKARNALTKMIEI